MVNRRAPTTRSESVAAAAAMTAGALVGGADRNGRGRQGDDDPRSGADGDGGSQENRSDDDNSEARNLAQTQRCEELVEQAAAGGLDGATFHAELVGLGLNAAAMEAWIDTLESRQAEIQQEKDDEEEDNHPATPEGLDGNELTDFRRRRQEAADRRPGTHAAAVEAILQQRIAARLCGCYSVRRKLR